MQSAKAASSKELKDMGALTCFRGYFFSFTLCKLLFCLLYGLALGLLVAAGSDFQEDQRQQREDKRLHKGDEEFQRDEEHIGEERQDVSKDRQYCTAREDVPQNTERKCVMVERGVLPGEQSGLSSQWSLYLERHAASYKRE